MEQQHGNSFRCTRNLEQAYENDMMDVDECLYSAAPSQSRFMARANTLDLQEKFKQSKYTQPGNSSDPSISIPSHLKTRWTNSSQSSLPHLHSFVSESSSSSDESMYSSCSSNSSCSEDNFGDFSMNPMDPLRTASNSIPVPFIEDMPEANFSYDMARTPPAGDEDCSMDASPYKPPIITTTPREDLIEIHRNKRDMQIDNQRNKRLYCRADGFDLSKNNPKIGTRRSKAMFQSDDFIVTTCQPNFPQQVQPVVHVSNDENEDVNLRTNFLRSRCQSMSDISTIKHRIPMVDTIKSRISTETMVNLLQNRYTHYFKKVVVIDCRYPYEFEGGHIANAINIPPSNLDNDLQSLFVHYMRESQEVAIVFHCEFSSKRGPAAFDAFRGMDRAYNKARYPELQYPFIYVLEGGYRDFYSQYTSFCEPRAYIEMKDKRYTAQLKCCTRMRKEHRKGRSNSMSGYHMGAVCRTISEFNTASSRKSRLTNSLRFGHYP